MTVECIVCEGTGRVTALIGNMAVADIAEGETVKVDVATGVGTIECAECGGTGLVAIMSGDANEPPPTTVTRRWEGGHGPGELVDPANPGPDWPTG